MPKLPETTPGPSNPDEFQQKPSLPRFDESFEFVELPLSTDDMRILYMHIPGLGLFVIDRNPDLFTDEQLRRTCDKVEADVKPEGLGTPEFYTGLSWNT